MPALHLLKRNTATSSTAASAGPRGRAGLDSLSRPSSTAVIVALAILRAYKLTLSPLFVGSCRFVPSCSDYATQAIRTHGVGKGAWLAARRLARCHPLCDGGHDQVPPRH
ncbi:MAG: membrane protein insertion efficiency factor YidD [Vicinamibacterales bacterium]